MRKHSTLRSSLLVLTFGILCSVGSAYAQLGKISAKITDAKTGEPLIRASIFIQETKQGALSKDNGVATIVNISPGVYTVIAKYANYEPQTFKNVKVQSDLTTNLTVKLSTTISKDTVVVIAQKLVDKSETKQSQRFNTEELVNVAGRQTVDKIVELTPGIVKDPSTGGFVVNGSRPTSVSQKFNNIEVTDIVDGQAKSALRTVSKFAVSELSVTTSGSDASAGGTTGGVISTSTKSGGTTTEFQAHYRQELPALFGTSGNGFKQMPQNDRIIEFALGGPITDELKYYITARGNARDYNNINEYSEANGGLAVVDPYGYKVGQVPHNNYFGRAITGKLSFDLLGFRLEADAAVTSESFQFNNYSLMYGDQAQLPAQNRIENIYSLKGVSNIGDAVVDFTLGYKFNSDRYGKYDQSAGGNLFKLYRMYEPKDNYIYDDITGTFSPGQDGIMDIYTPVSKQIPDPRDPSKPLNLNGAGLNPLTGHIEGGTQSYTTANPYGLLNQFYAAGNPAGYSVDTRNTIQAKATYSQQIGEHYINSGFEASLYSIKSFDNGLPWDANPFKDSFETKPFLGALYIIDKMEFNDITFNPSLRFDIFNPSNDRQLANPYNPCRKIINSQGDTVTNCDFVNAPIQTQLSPRLGITYAVTEMTTFNFNYGQYFKQPLLSEVFRSTGGDFSRVLLRGNQIIGNGGLKAERSTEIVVGFTTALSDLLAMTVQGVYKDLRNLSGLTFITSDYLPTGYTLYSDDQYGNSKSIQLSFEKRMRDNYSVRFNYTLSRAVGTSSSATDNYGRLINPPGTDISTLPLQPYPLSFDRPHVMQLLTTISWRKGEGPTIFGEKLLELFNLSFTTEFKSGLPYTRQDRRGNQSGEFNGARHPSYFNTDASLSRSILLSDLFGDSFGSSAIDLELEVLNLFNNVGPRTVYARTGQGDDDGSDGIYTGTVIFKNDPTNADGQQLDALGYLKYNPRWDLNKDNLVDLSEQQLAFTQLRNDRLARRTNYFIPRRVYFNVTFRF